MASEVYDIREARAEIERLRAKLALEAENSLGDDEIIDIFRDIVSAEDDFCKSTGMKSNDALHKAINRARDFLQAAGK